MRQRRGMNCPSGASSMKNGLDAVLQRVSDWGLVERVDGGRVTEND